MKLSILICAVPERNKQAIQMLSEQATAEVEVLWLGDNKKMSIGEKRNKLVAMAKGDYMCFVDDDDYISPDYVESILDKIEEGRDVITFNAKRYINGVEDRGVSYSIKYLRDVNSKQMFFRIPNHLCPIRREIAVKVKYPEMNYGEDAAYASFIKKYLKTESHIDKYLYFYMDKIHKYRSDIKEMDVVILSYAKNDELKQMTNRCIQSLVDSDKIKFNIIVYESEDLNGYQYDHTKTIYLDEEFNYNRYMNKGFEEGTAKYVAFCNNDLEFAEGWATQMIKYMDLYKLDSASPLCPIHHGRQIINDPVLFGDRVGQELIGWCIVVNRDSFAELGGFDDYVTFYCSDNAYQKQLEKTGYKHGLITRANVIHLLSKTLQAVGKEKQTELTVEQVKKYNLINDANIFGLGHE